MCVQATLKQFADISERRNYYFNRIVQYKKIPSCRISWLSSANRPKKAAIILSKVEDWYIWYLSIPLSMLLIHSRLEKRLV